MVAMDLEDLAAVVAGLGIREDLGIWAAMAAGMETWADTVVDTIQATEVRTIVLDMVLLPVDTRDMALATVLILATAPTPATALVSTEQTQAESEPE